MNPRTTGLLLLAVLGVGAFIWFYEIGGEDARLDAEERSKRLFAVEPEAVAWIALRTSDGVDARFEQRDGSWQLVEPLVFPADAAVGRMAEGLAGLLSEARFDEPGPDAEYGLDDASARIVRFGTGDASHELRLGRETPVGSNVYARTGDSPAVHVVESFRATAFERALADLREKQILDFDTGAIREVEARWPGGRVVLVREEQPEPAPEQDAGDETGTEPWDAGEPSEWRMTVPVAARADADAVDGLLSTLSFLRAEGFVDAPGEAQRRLLDPPEFEVELRSGAGEAPSAALAVGRADADGLRLVRNGGGVLFQIPDDRLEDFPRDPVAYRYRRLASFPASAAQQVEFFFQSETGDPVALHAERGEAGWTSSPEAFAAGSLAGVVSALSRLEADDILAESMGESELAGLGLSPPRTILSVFGAAPEPDAEAGEDVLPPPAPRLAEVHLGRVTPEGVVARAAGEPAVYRLGPEIAERLPVSLEAFRNRFRAAAAEEPVQLPGADADVELVDPADESP